MCVGFRLSSSQSQSLAGRTWDTTNVWVRGPFKVAGSRIVDGVLQGRTGSVSLLWVGVC